MGNIQRICQNNGMWSGSNPTCDGIFATTYNILIMLHTFIHPGQCYNYVSSNIDYFHSIVVDCGSLTSPPNGQVTVSTTTFNSLATYACNTGFTLEGNMQRTCQDSGFWSGTDPTCIGML